MFVPLQKLRRSWRSESDDRPYAALFPVHPLSDTIVACRRALYESNDIPIHITPLPKLLLSVCLNPFYCFQAFSCALWVAEHYWIYATCILIMSVISLITQLCETRRNETSLKKTIHSSSSVTVCREKDGVADFFEIDSTELVPGDVIEVPRKGCVMHCDAFILNGNCIVNESTLTGESVPVTKTALPEHQQRNDHPGIPSLARYVLFGGTSVIQTRNYANERVLAMVARTGFRTAKGELVRSILYPKPMKFKFTQDSMKFIGALAAIALVGLGVSVYLMHRVGVKASEIALRGLDLITIVIPPALPVAMTVGIVFAQRRLRKHNIYCINPNAITVCGVINVTCFDKTGTLTEDGMDLWGVLPNDQGNFDEPHFNPSELKRGPLLEAIATCHSLTLIEGVLSGDPLDLKMFQSTKWEFIEQISEDHCKFGMAVPAIVRPETKYTDRDIAIESALDSDDLPYEIGILRQFPFTSSLQRMSVIARVLNSTYFSVYTKGAPELIETLCRRDTIPSDYQSVLLQYTREGYRVLALAWRPLKVPYTRILRLQRERAEHDLLFLGFLIMENRLKPETAPVIQTLRNANIRPVMVTGDNMLTAVSVARDCEIIDEMDRIIIVSAKPPPQIQPPNPGSPSTLAGGDVSRLDSDSCVPHEGHTALQDYSLSSDQQTPLVEFHYAEDLHKPVTEVTATSGCRARFPRGCRGRRKSRLSALAKVDSIFSRIFRRKNASRSRLDHSRVTYGPMIPTSEVVSNLAVPVDDNVIPDQNHFTHDPELGTRISEPPPTHRVNIRMIDRPDFHLAISGKTWAVIKDHYPWLIPKLVVKGTVFARFSPDQKAQLIEALQSVGYYVAMCGDGANDCGALKAAHAGVSLSEAEASVASPFTSKKQNIGCVPTLIREGRCALMTSFGTFKFMTGYSLVQFFTTILLYTIGGNITDLQFLFIDLLLITTLSVTFGYTKAYPHLSVEPPPLRLLSAVTLMSLGFQVVVNCLFQFLAYVWVRMQPWYIPVFRVSDAYELMNFEGTAVFRISAYQYIILAVVFSKGAPYRKSILTNYIFICNLLLCTALTAYVATFPATPLLAYLEMLPLPSLRFVLLLHAAAVANFLLCYVLELVVDGVSFRRRLLHIRRALFPRHVQRKDYERIREEIDKLAGSWPPIIRSASVQALPKELFHDTYANAPTAIADSRTRKRTTSCLSSASEDEECMSPVRTDHSQHATLLSNMDACSPPLPHSNATSEFIVGDGRQSCQGWKSSRNRRLSCDKPRRRHSFSELQLTTNVWNRHPIIVRDDNENVTSPAAADVMINKQHIGHTVFAPTDKRKRSQSGGLIFQPLLCPTNAETRFPFMAKNHFTQC